RCETVHVDRDLALVLLERVEDRQTVEHLATGRVQVHLDRAGHVFELADEVAGTGSPEADLVVDVDLGLLRLGLEGEPVTSGQRTILTHREAPRQIPHVEHPLIDSSPTQRPLLVNNCVRQSLAILTQGGTILHDVDLMPPKTFSASQLDQTTFDDKFAEDALGFPDLDVDIEIAQLVQSVRGEEG